MKLSLRLMFVLLLFLLSGCSLQSNNQEKDPESILGVMNLNGTNMSEGSLIKLNGEWSFYWNQLLQPSDIQSGVGKQTGYIYMPSNWYEYKVDGENLPRTGFATFTLQLKINEPNQPKGLILPVMYSNYKLWIDDQLVAVSGKVGMNHQQSVPQKSTDIVFFNAHSDQVQIVLQISNYHNYAGGMWEPIIYGSASEVLSAHNWNLAGQCILFGILLLAGIYHIGLSVFRKKDYSMLYFGFFCLVVALRNLFVGDVFLTKIFPNFQWEIAMKLEYICLYLMVPFLSLFIEKIFPEESYRIVGRVSVVLAIIYSFITLIMTADIYYRILIIFQLYMVIALIYGLIVLIRATFHKRDGAVYALVGFFALIVTSLFDIFGFILKYSGQAYYSAGVTIFIVCFSLVLSKKLSISFNMSEQLAHELTELNDSLDKKVKERTSQLEQTNKKLEKLNAQLQEWSMVDGLTNLSNRRHFDDYLCKHIQLSIQKDTPTTLLLIDIDYFKLYNDTYGHIQGDYCLQMIASSIQMSISSYDGLAARYGGEEFAVILPNCRKEIAIEVANKICIAIRELKIPHTESKAADYVTVSIGMANVNSQSDLEPKKLIDLADQNLYKAKHLGKNQVYFEESIKN